MTFRQYIRTYLHDKHGIWFHAQDLKREERSRHLTHGRCWLHIHPEYVDEEKGTAQSPRRKPSWYTGCVGFSWGVPGRHPGVSVDVSGPGGDDDVTFHLGLILFDVWLSFEGLGFQKINKVLIPSGYEGRETGIRFFDNAVWWDVWHTDMSWTSTTPRWRHGSWHLLDSFFGGMTRKEETLKEAFNVPVPMPEGVYLADVRLVRNVWTRKRLPRWLFAKTFDGADVKMQEGQQLPMEGKGTESYNMEDDATYSSYMYGPKTVEDAVGKMVAGTLGDRMHRSGSYGWHTPPDHSGSPIQSITAPKEEI